MEWVFLTIILLVLFGMQAWRVREAHRDPIDESIMGHEVRKQDKHRLQSQLLAHLRNRFETERRTAGHNPHDSYLQDRWEHTAIRSPRYGLRMT